VLSATNGLFSWKDYWDLNAIANMAWFQSAAAAGDMSWVFDATGLI
jgi:hypothetical protein